MKKNDGPGNTTLANQLDIENWTLINKTPDLPQQDNQTDCGVSLNIQKDPGGLSFSMNNVLGYQLMFFEGYIDGKARNRRNRMFGGPHELSHQVASILLGVTAAEPYLCTKISLIKLCAA